MADYQLMNHGFILRVADGANIPPDPANTDFVAYEKWLSEGNTPDPAPPPPPPPAPQADANARLDAGIAAALSAAVAVRDAMDAIPDVLSNSNFAETKVQLDALAAAVVAMLQAQDA